MCQGLMRSAAALSLTGLLKGRPMPFNTEEQYFEQRFFILTQVAAPAPLSYDDYASVMNLDGEKWWSRFVESLCAQSNQISTSFSSDCPLLMLLSSKNIHIAVLIKL